MRILPKCLLAIVAVWSTQFAAAHAVDLAVNVIAYEELARACENDDVEICFTREALVFPDAAHVAIVATLMKGDHEPRREAVVICSRTDPRERAIACQVDAGSSLEGWEIAALCEREGRIVAIAIRRRIEGPETGTIDIRAFDCPSDLPAGKVRVRDESALPGLCRALARTGPLSAKISSMVNACSEGESIVQFTNSDDRFASCFDLSSVLLTQTHIDADGDLFMRSSSDPGSVIVIRNARSERERTYVRCYRPGSPLGIKWSIEEGALLRACGGLPRRIIPCSGSADGPITAVFECVDDVVGTGGTRYVIGSIDSEKGDVSNVVSLASGLRPVTRPALMNRGRSLAFRNRSSAGQKAIVVVSRGTGEREHEMPCLDDVVVGIADDECIITTACLAVMVFEPRKGGAAKCIVGKE